MKLIRNKRLPRHKSATCVCGEEDISNLGQIILEVEGDIEEEEENDENKEDIFYFFIFTFKILKIIKNKERKEKKNFKKLNGKIKKFESIP